MVNDAWSSLIVVVNDGCRELGLLTQLKSSTHDLWEKVVVNYALDAAATPRIHPICLQLKLVSKTISCVAGLGCWYDEIVNFDEFVKKEARHSETHRIFQAQQPHHAS